MKGEEVIFSELSPRPHDTGMVTLGWCGRVLISGLGDGEQVLFALATLLYDQGQARLREISEIQADIVRRRRKR